jgi:hypothetical protein
MPNFLIDDRPVDLSQFEGFTSEDIDETIMYLEEQERLRIERSRNQTKSEQVEDLKRCECKYKTYIDNIRKKRLLKTG